MLHHLNQRQRRRIMSEIRANLRSKSRLGNDITQSDTLVNVQDRLKPENPEALKQEPTASSASTIAAQQPKNLKHNTKRCAITAEHCTTELMEYNIENQKIYEKLDRIETELKKLSNSMECVLKCLKVKQDRQRCWQKPTCLPLSTEEEMEVFETVDEDTYGEVVDYFQYVGGFTVKEAVTLSFKEAIKDSLTTAFTWFGREEGTRPLYNSRIIMAIYDAVCNNRHFPKPSRTEFQAYMREALRSAKQRHRSSQGKRQRQENTARNLWNDKENGTSEELHQLTKEDT